MTVKPDTINRTWAATGGTSALDLTRYNSGWLLEVLKFTELNQLQQDFSLSIKHNNEEGINLWDTVTSYPLYAYTKASDGNIYKANVANANKNPLTSSEWVRWGQEFATNTTMAFYQTAAPLGYVQDLTVTNHMMVVTNGAGGSTVGTDDPTAAHSHTVNNHSHPTSGAIITIAQMPKHQFATAWGSAENGLYGNAAGGSIYRGTGAAIDNDNNMFLTNELGSGQAHYHGNTGGSSPGTSSNYTPKHAKFIICKKS